MPPQLGGDGLVVPGAGTDEVLEVLPSDAGLSGDRLDALALQATEQATDESAGMAPLLLTREQGEVSLEEALEMIATALDVVRRKLGVGEKDLSLVMIEQRHDGASEPYAFTPPIVNPIIGKVLQNL
jgi:hypothetical protein